MKKLIAVLAIVSLLMPLVACNDNANKKVIPETTPPENKVVEQQPQLPEQKSADAADNGEDKPDVSNTDSREDQKIDEQKEVNLTDLPSDLSNEKISNWMPGRNKEHKVPMLNSKFKDPLDKYDGYFVGDTSSKVIYLTFDEGYENGYTGVILDILKANDVKAAFFVTKSYIKSNPDLVKRMAAEGHIVGNHTTTHPQMPDTLSKKGVEGVKKELNDTADYYKEITGEDMPLFYRPPEGVWSEATLYITKSMGYKTILWSMAHKDWDRNNQPGKEASYNFVDTYYHNGAILLLHAVSKSNTEALGDIIKNMREKGYRFAPLTEL